MVERAAGRSYREIATIVGYRSPSSVIDAIRAGIDRSGLRAGLAVVMRDRVDRLDDQLAALEPVIGHRVHYAPLLDATMMLHARLEFEADLAGQVPGVRDVAKLVARRRPDLPELARLAYPSPFWLRQMEATLDQMRGRYAHRSGVHRALERDLRRELLFGVSEFYAAELTELRAVWHEIGRVLRRTRIEPRVMLDLVDRLTTVLEALDVIWVWPAPSPHARVRRRGRAFGPPGLPTRDTTRPRGTRVVSESPRTVASAHGPGP
jgi:hypothetical protein